MKETGKLFGEDGSFAIIGGVRVEVTKSRMLLAGEPGDWPKIEAKDSSTSFAYDQTDQMECSWNFVPPHQPPAPVVITPPPPAPPLPPTLAEQLRDLAPRLPIYADAIISGLLAILLLIAGMLTLGDRRRGRTLHLV